MKCSPFTRSFRKERKHMHRHRGRSLSSSSSSSSDGECHRNRHTESDSDMQHRMEHYGMKSKKHDFGMMQGRKHGRDMMHRMRHGEGMMYEMGHHHRHGMEHHNDHGMGHHHGMAHYYGMGHHHDMEDGHGMMHEREHDHGTRRGHGMMHRMRHGHSMKHWHNKNHGREHDHFMEHRMRHRHGMKHKMHHGHGKRLGHGHGPGMDRKLRHAFERCSPDNQNEARPIEVDTGNVNENSESEAFTFYKPKTNAQVLNENDKFQISLETSYYQPGEVSVKIVDGKIDISAMHESMEDNIYEFHEMYRSFNIPDSINPESITARLDADGKLIVEAECQNPGEGSQNERDVPIIRVSE